MPIRTNLADFPVFINGFPTNFMDEFKLYLINAKFNLTYLTYYLKNYFVVNTLRVCDVLKKLFKKGKSIFLLTMHVKLITTSHSV